MNKGVFGLNMLIGIGLSVLIFIGGAYAGEADQAKQSGLNQPPKGFVALFNGKDLTGWKGLVGDPKTRQNMGRQELADAQAKADEVMRAHWKAVDGVLCFDGKGHSLCTAKEYGDFELLVDWKIESGGDSGIYLRGSPQVQIWDPANRGVGAEVGSGGLYNNQKGSSKPLKLADRPIGQWNTFRIVMINELVTVYLNDVLVVENVVMENYWERDKLIYSIGQIELQSHSSPLYFRNVFIREIPRESGTAGLSDQEKAENYVSLFNGQDLTGWTGSTKGYLVKDGKIVLDPKLGGGNLYTVNQYSDFVLRFEFRLTPGANNGLAIRAPLSGDPAYVGMEIQILDDTAAKYSGLRPYQYHGSIYGVVPAKTWLPQTYWPVEFRRGDSQGRRISVVLNSTTIVDADIDEAGRPKTVDERDHPGLKRQEGHVGFCGHGDYVEFCNIRIKVLR